MLISSLYPLGGNYGGMLQAFALQRSIRTLGYDAVTVNSEVSRMRLKPKLIKLYLVIKALRERLPTPATISKADREVLWSFTNEFVSKNIATVDLFSMSLRRRRKYLNKFHAIVVGSDQVWRRPYSELSRQFLQYAYGLNIRKFSYAASFGIDNVSEYSFVQKVKARILLQQFSSLSVREDSGVTICRQNFQLDAELHVDPTMLLSRKDYTEVIQSSQELLDHPKNVLFSYILDNDISAKVTTESLATSMKLDVESFLVQLPSTASQLSNDLDSFKLEPVESWLNGIRNARYVVTDSFHGTVFSIIFNKPFIVLRNPRRGSARIESLLRMFNLENRTIEAGSPSEAILNLKEPNWARVNAILEKERSRGINYLRRALDHDNSQ